MKKRTTWIIHRDKFTWHPHVTSRMQDKGQPIIWLWERSWKMAGSKLLILLTLREKQEYNRLLASPFDLNWENKLNIWINKAPETIIEVDEVVRILYQGICTLKKVMYNIYQTKLNINNRVNKYVFDVTINRKAFVYKILSVRIY